MKEKIIKFFIGLILGISIWLVTFFGIYQIIVHFYLIPNNINEYFTSYFKPSFFMVEYPFLLSVLVAGYFTFFRRNYILSVGVLFGFFLALGCWGGLLGMNGGV